MVCTKKLLLLAWPCTMSIPWQSRLAALCDHGIIMLYSHLVPEPPTLTNAFSGLNPASRGSNKDAQAAAKSSRVTNGFWDNGCSGKGRLWLAAWAVDILTRKRHLVCTRRSWEPCCSYCRQNCSCTPLAICPNMPVNRNTDEVASMGDLSCYKFSLNRTPLPTSQAATEPKHHPTPPQPPPRRASVPRILCLSHSLSFNMEEMRTSLLEL